MSDQGEVGRELTIGPGAFDHHSHVLGEERRHSAPQPYGDGLCPVCHVEYFDGADGSSNGDDEDGSEDAWSLTGR